MSKFKTDKVMPRYFAIAVALTLIGFAVVGKAMYIMTVKKDYWTQVADRLKRDSVSVKPARGNILSCDGQLMASSIPEYRIFMDFQAGTGDSLSNHRHDSLWTEKIDSICYELNQIFPTKSAAEFKAHLLEGMHKVQKNGSVGARHWAIWPRRIDYNTFCEVHKLPIFKEPVYKGGFHWEEFNSRNHPFGTLAWRTIGDMFGAKDSAKNGLELSFDSLLRGTNGLMHRRKVLNKYMDIPVQTPIDGYDIVTTIDVGMQDLAERAVIEELKEINGEMGVAILMEVKTGDVKAIVNMQRGADGEYHEMVNNAISYRCEPGSVFKIFTVASLYDAGLIKANDSFLCDGVFEQRIRGGETIRIKCLEHHGWVTPREALKYSCNDALAQIATRTTDENFMEMVRRLGFGRKTGIELPSETPGSVKEVGSKLWSARSKPTIAMGQEISVSALQMIQAASAIANKGIPVKPAIIKRITNKDGSIDYEHRAQNLERVFKESTAEYLLSCMETTAQSGTGSRARLHDISIGVKTGTAQMADKNGGYSTTDFLSNCMAVFPIEDPQIILYIVIVKAKGETYAGRIVAPVIAKAADEIIDHLGMSRGDAASLEHNGKITISSSKQLNFGEKMPDFTGMSMRELLPLFNRKDIRIKINGSGWVKEQTPEAGTPITENMLIELNLE